MSLLTGFEFSLVSSFDKFFISFCLALLTDAKLLSRASISSLKALETVNFVSLFLTPVFKVFLSLFPSLPLILFVALCSANFLLSKSLVEVIGFDDGSPLNVDVILGFDKFDLNDPDPPLTNGLLNFFLITVEFFS